MSQPYSAALPIAYVALRILIVVNWVLGACILGLLVYTFVNELWTMRALGVTDYPDAQLVMNAMRVVAVLGVVTIPLNHAILARLLAMVHTVRAGDPVRRGQRLSSAGDRLGAARVAAAQLVIGGIGEAISTSEHPVDLDAGFSISGWLAVLLSFLLARVFAEAR